jgi:hypothetical protein
MSHRNRSRRTAQTMRMADSEPGTVVPGYESVSELPWRWNSCHGMIVNPHPHPLPKGEGAFKCPALLPSPPGRGQGEGLLILDRATILEHARILRQFPIFCPLLGLARTGVPNGQRDGQETCTHG